MKKKNTMIIGKSRFLSLFFPFFLPFSFPPHYLLFYFYLIISYVSYQEKYFPILEFIANAGHTDFQLNDL